jgi:hypothetical protein
MYLNELVGGICYITASAVYTHVGLNIGSGVVNDFAISAFSLKQVTAPSADGCTIQASKTDATENFGYKNASFTYNAASYLCVVRKLR